LTYSDWYYTPVKIRMAEIDLRFCDSARKLFAQQPKVVMVVGPEMTTTTY